MERRTGWGCVKRGSTAEKRHGEVLAVEAVWRLTLRSEFGVLVIWLESASGTAETACPEYYAITILATGLVSHSDNFVF